MFFRKHFLPWTAGEAFENEEAYQNFLKRKHKLFTDLRMIAIVIAAVPLIIGYVLNLRPIMLVTIVPLILVLALSMALDRVEKQL